MNYIVFDLEWNQPENAKSSTQEKLPFEIIEIGAVKLNENLEMVSEFQELIRPTVYRRINWRTKKMLNLKNHELDHCRNFKAVCREFLDWCGEEPVFCTWGSQDLTELQRNMHYYHFLPLSDGPIAYYNIQAIFGAFIEEEQNQKNLEAAVDLMQIVKDVPFHRAFSDAYYTSKIMQRLGHKYLDGNNSYDLYHIPCSTKQEVNDYNGTVSYFVSKGYEQKTDITENRKIMQVNCPECNGRVLRQKVRWFQVNSKTYYSAAVCEKHGPVKGKIRIKKDQHDKFYAEKIINVCSITRNMVQNP